VRLKGKGFCVAHSPKSPAQRERLAAALRENLKRRKAQARDQDSRVEKGLAAVPAAPAPVEPPAPASGDLEDPKLG